MRSGSGGQVPAELATLPWKAQGGEGALFHSVVFNGKSQSLFIWISEILAADLAKMDV